MIPQSDDEPDDASGDERAEIEARRRAVARLKRRHGARPVPLAELDRVVAPVECRRTRERARGGVL